MKPVSPEEISALLDGELAPDRAGEVRRAIAEDPKLGEVYQQLAALDRDLSSFAAACQFTPHLSLPSGSPAPDISVWVIALGLLAVRTLARILAFGPSVGVQVVALALVIAWLLYGLLPRVQHDPSLVAQELGLRSAWNGA
jgi:anti-sigma factor RsiW